MEYARRRKRRSKTNSSSAAKVVLALLILAGVVYLVCASAVGTWLAQNVIAPLFGSTGAKEQQLQPTPAVTTQSGTSNAEIVSSAAAGGGEVTASEVNVPALTCFTLQMGAYQSEVNAAAQARDLRNRGAGGYILKDGERYRVLAAGYENEADLQSVRAQLAAEGMDSAGYTITAPLSVLKVTATDSQQQAIKGAFDALWTFQNALGETALDFDKNARSVADGKTAVAALTRDLESAYTTFSTNVTDTGEVLDGIRGCFKTMFDEVSALDETSAVTFSADLKHAHLASCAAYAELGMCIGS